ncbi:DUF438 domain-containing protein [Collinsella sp. zg1085]|uniref:DUF438 domain-containing protein n=1 Tax=Collinsella sp. zg1085 TaxID=2844380 RepID=UPI001C0D61D5|nr:DUF438 domain-containing protein [Collinsella sp. zg1085]QWT18212.1 DUF438 domain-containing protein [Collinsella sp. zg1085]
MAGKTINLDESVYSISKAYPEIIELMAKLGFTEITLPGRLATMGRFMTIPQGCEFKKIDLADVVRAFRAAGFEVEGSNLPEALKERADASTEDSNQIARTPEERQKLLRSFLERLGNGESVEDVQEDFRRNFESVSGSEIAAAEQALMASGVAIEEVQRLCDVHATLFEGGIACAVPQGEAGETPGHPVQLMLLENKAIAEFLQELEEHLELAAKLPEDMKAKSVATLLYGDLDRYAQVFTHYKRKEELLFPHLEQHNIMGPSSVMWGKDDEIRDQVKLARERLDWAGAAVHALVLREVAEILKKAAIDTRSMIDKEEQVLIPLALENLSATEWTQIAADGPEIGYAFIEKPVIWRADALELANDRIRALKLNNELERVEDTTNASSTTEDSAPESEQLIKLSTGSFTVAQLEAVLNTIPLDMTFVDSEDKTRYFSHGDTRAFPRPMSCLGRDVYACHPPKSQEMVRMIFENFKSGESDSFDFWFHRGDAFLYVRYFAVRDAEGNYLGALETTQDIAEIRSLEGENRRGSDK